MTSVSNNKPGTLIFRSGFRPELVAVVSGSYFSNFSFGPGASVLVSFNDITGPHGIKGTISGNNYYNSTYCEYRKQDNFVVFSLGLTIRQNNVPPPQNEEVQGELRIRVLNPLISGIGFNPKFMPPDSYSRGLPPPSNNYMSPTVDFLQAYATSTGFWTPGIIPVNLTPFVATASNNVRFNGRILADSTIALFFEFFELVDTNGEPVQGPFELPFTVDLFLQTMESIGEDFDVALQFAIRGHYICA